MQLLSISFPESFLASVDCYDEKAMRPFVLVGGFLALFTFGATIVVRKGNSFFSYQNKLSIDHKAHGSHLIQSLFQFICATLASLRNSTSLSEKTRAHHRTMTRVLIMQVSSKRNLNRIEKKETNKENLCQILDENSFQALVPGCCIGAPCIAIFALMSRLTFLDGKGLLEMHWVAMKNWQSFQLCSSISCYASPVIPLSSLSSSFARRLCTDGD